MIIISVSSKLPSANGKQSWETIHLDIVDSTEHQEYYIFAQDAAGGMACSLFNSITQQNLIVSNNGGSMCMVLPK
jgi:hypothetical protein